MKDYSFGNNIYELRNARRLSQKELGQKLGVSDKAVSRWENGSSKPRASLLPKLAGVLGVSVDRLLGGKGDTTHSIIATASGDFIDQKYTADTTDKIRINFIPDCGKFAGNYLCTWHTQFAVAKRLNIQGETVAIRQRNAMNENTLFKEELYHPYNRHLRKSLIFLIDDGWDVPKDAGSVDTSIFGAMVPDPEKFASLGNTDLERLTEISRRVKELGYYGLGLWVSPQRVGLPSFEGVEDDRSYWEERATLSHKAGVVYWKVDWGRNSHTPGYREMMTECVRRCAPGLMIEHAREHEPFNPDSVDVNQQRVKAMSDRWEYSDFLRTYDVAEPFGDSETFGRTNALLKILDPKKLRHGAKGFINVESQPLVAVGLSLNLGIMEYSLEDEAALKWQQICPPYSAARGEYQTSAETVSEHLRFDTNLDHWKRMQWQELEFEVPVAASRCAKLPKVECDGTKPIVLCSSNPDANALCVSTLRRCIDPNLKVAAPADITVYPEEVKTTVGVFGFYKSLTLEYSESLPKNVTVWAQCLLDGNAVNVTDKVQIGKNTITFDGLYLRELGHKAGESSIAHEPALMIKIL